MLCFVTRSLVTDAESHEESFSIRTMPHSKNVFVFYLIMNCSIVSFLLDLHTYCMKHL